MSLKKETLWSLAPVIVTTAFNVLSVPLFYRFLGAETYALLFYVQTFTTAFGFMDLGFGVAVGRYIGVALGRGDQTAVRAYWATGNMLAIPLLALMALFFIGAGVTFGTRWFNIPATQIGLLHHSFVAGGVGLFLTYYGQFWLVLSQAHLDFKFLSIVRMGVMIVQVVPSLYFAYLTRNPLVLLWWGAFASFVQLFVFFCHARKAYGMGFNFREASLDRFREMAGYTGQTFLTLLIASWVGSVDRFLLGRLAAPADFTHYMIPTNAGGRISSLSQAVMGPVFHNTSRAVGGTHTRTPAEIFNEMFYLLFGWYALLAVWTCVWRLPLLTFWLGADLATTVAPIFTPLIVAYCLSAVANISISQLGPLNRLNVALGFQVLSGISILGFIYAGWKFGGIVGVAYGFLASRVIAVAQDIFVIRLIGADGWLSSKTWLQLTGHAAAGCALYAIAKFWDLSLFAQSVLAILHLGVASTVQLKQSLFSGEPSDATPTPAPTLHT